MKRASTADDSRTIFYCRYRMKEIFEYHGKSQPLKDEIIDSANNELYDDYLYKLLLMELASILQFERNITLRKQIISLIKKTDFNKFQQIIKITFR